MKDQYSLLLFVVILFCSIFSARAQYVDFDHDGITRQYIYYEPSVLNDQMPLVFVMHGFTDDASNVDTGCTCGPRCALVAVQGQGHRAAATS